MIKLIICQYLIFTHLILACLNNGGRKIKIGKKISSFCTYVYYFYYTVHVLSVCVTVSMFALIFLTVIATF